MFLAPNFQRQNMTKHTGPSTSSYMNHNERSNPIDDYPNSEYVFLVVKKNQLNIQNTSGDLNTYHHSQNFKPHQTHNNLHQQFNSQQPQIMNDLLQFKNAAQNNNLSYEQSKQQLNSTNATSSNYRSLAPKVPNSFSAISFYQTLSQIPEKEKVCQVCSDSATGYHYGVFCCEGCKAFFKRSTQGNAPNYVCPATDNCRIDRQRRRACQKCRLAKCFAVGMTKTSKT